MQQGLPRWYSGKEFTCQCRIHRTRTAGWILQYSCLENSMDRGAWWATVHGVAELDRTERLKLTLSVSMSDWNSFLWGNFQRVKRFTICAAVSFLKNIFIYLVAPGLSCGTQDLGSSLPHTQSFSCSMWALVPWQGMESGPPELRAQSLSHWTTWEVPVRWELFP